MSDQAAIEHVLDNLNMLATHPLDPIPKASKVEQLNNDLRYFGALLKYASKNQLKPELTRQIRVTVYEAEDTVDAFITHTLSPKSSLCVSQLFKVMDKLDGIAEKIHQLRDEVEKVYGDMTKLEVGEDGSEKLEFPSVRKERHLIGLNESSNDIIGYIKEETNRLDIIAIVGMLGIGKSTLARKIFQDPSTQDEFPMRLWVSVSKFPTRNVFLSMLTGFSVIMKDVHRMTEYDLANVIERHLQARKFLIVFDDVRTPEDWSKLSIALPMTSNRLGKVLITSRCVDVAPNPYRPQYKMDLWNPEKSAELLQYEVSGEPAWESGLEHHGELTAQKCKGIPLAIAVIGGVIGKELSVISHHSAKVDAWMRFSERVDHHLVDDPVEMMEKVVSLSYEKLPSQLRDCFLYFGMFPESVEIPTWKLFQMWIAEGFFGQRIDSIRQEDVAESYLDELISRNLVSVGKTSIDGKVKTCRIHDLILDFCKKLAVNEKFLQEITGLGDGISEPLVDKDNDYRRLCIHSNLPEFAASKPFGHRVRSIVCTSTEDVILPQEHVLTIPRGFKLLRVFDAKPIKFPKLPATLFDMIHLKFVHLSSDISTIPPAFSTLRNMQTLIVESSQRALQVDANIWKMRNLRHLKTNITATLLVPRADEDKITNLRVPRAATSLVPHNASALDESNLQTLGVISSESCTDKFLDTFPHLRRASVRGKLVKLLTGKSNEGSFDNLAKLTKLEKLKLQNDVSAESPSDAKLPRLPPSQAFPPSLRILTLADTFLDWSEMKAITSLDKLEVLKLKRRAFMGERWETDDGGFRGLKHLLVGHTDLVIWKTSPGHFPALVHLELRHCDELREVPIEFAEVRSFKLLSLNSCRTAAASAKEIKRQKTEADGIEFNLTIVSSA